MKDWKIEQLTGYKPHTNYYLQFSMAEPYGISAIANVFNNIFSDCKYNTVSVTELAMAVNWKIYEHYDKEKQLAHFYQSIWDQVDNYCKGTLTDSNLRYYQKTIEDCCSW